MLEKMEKRDDDERKKDKRFLKKGKRGKGNKTDANAVASRTLHTPSVPEFSEEEEEEEEDDGEQNGGGDVPKKKGDSKPASIGQLRYVLQFQIVI